MISVAAIKHIASKNSDYGESEQYLIFQHNEHTQQPILDEEGHMLLREKYYLKEESQKKNIGHNAGDRKNSIS